MGMPLSKQRNKHIQRALVEAAKLAPRQSHELALIYDKEKQKGNSNRATLAVARKMVAYPGPACCRLSEGDQTPKALYELFRDWQRTQIQSSVEALRSPRQQMDVWFCRVQEPMPRGTLCA